jgi:ferric-dicitrate binding protein FerR (iron transport regulator)
MRPSRAWLSLSLWLVATAAHAAAEIGVATLADAGALVLRGATWYRLAPGVTIEDGDIVATDGKEQTQVELAGGSIVSLAGDALVLVAAAPGAMPSLTLHAGLLKAAVKPPGLRVRTPAFDAVLAEGIMVLRAGGGNAEVFVEAGSARLTRRCPATSSPRFPCWRRG